MNALATHLTEELTAIIAALDSANPDRAHWLARKAIDHIEAESATSPSDPRTIATILAALRYWQQDLEANEEPPISEHFQEHTHLSTEEIDELCESLNFGDGEEINPLTAVRHETIRLLAQEQHASDEIEIDSDAAVSEGCGNGAYVTVRIWTSFDGTPLDKTPEEEPDDSEVLDIDCTLCTDESCAWCQEEKALRNA